MRGLIINKIDVVAAVIKIDDRYFIAQRDNSKHLGGQWEFPGGKIDPGETPEQALTREMIEEFATLVKPEKLLGDVVHSYTERTIHLFFYSASVIDGTLTLWSIRTPDGQIKALLQEGLLAEGDLAFVKSYIPA